MNTRPSSSNPLARRNTALLLRGRYNAWRWTFGVFAAIVILVLNADRPFGGDIYALALTAGVAAVALAHAASDLFARAPRTCAMLPVSRPAVCAAAWRRAVIWWPAFVATLLGAVAARDNAAPWAAVDVVAFTMVFACVAAVFSAGAAGATAGEWAKLFRGGTTAGRLSLWVLLYQLPNLALIFGWIRVQDGGFTADVRWVVWSGAAMLCAISWMLRGRFLGLTTPRKGTQADASREQHWTARKRLWTRRDAPLLTVVYVGFAALFAGWLVLSGSAEYRVGMLGFVMLFGVPYLWGKRLRSSPLYRMLPRTRSTYVVTHLAPLAAATVGAYAALWLAGVTLLRADPVETTRWLALWCAVAALFAVTSVQIRRHGMSPRAWVTTSPVVVPMLVVGMGVVASHPNSLLGDRVPAGNPHSPLHGIAALPPLHIAAWALLAALVFYALVVLALHLALRDPNFYRNHWERG